MPDTSTSTALAAPPGDQESEPRAFQAGDFFNRELSWLEFNRRVLEEALGQDNRLLERVKFLSIFSNNLDEFFMVRLAGLGHQLETGVVQPPADGMSPAAQLAAIRERLLPMLQQCAACWQEDLEPALAREGIHVLGYGKLRRRQRERLRRYFETEIFPVLTPLAFDPAHPFPHISSLSLNLAVVIRDPGNGERFARLKVPLSLPRLVRVPDEERAGDVSHGPPDSDSHANFVWIEEVVAANLDLLFPGLEVVDAFPFRVTRNADFEIEEDEADDLLTAMAEVVEQRHFGSVIRLEIDRDMPERIRGVLVRNLKVQPYQVYILDGPIGLVGISELTRVARPELKDPPFLAAVPPAFAGEESIFAAIRRRDRVLYHPYDSFQPMVRFLEEAATDPDVKTIKQTLYRVGTDSPIVAALMEARQNGKQVAVLVELKARFDEENNIVWAKQLERAGVHVVYGVVGLKTHAKMSLVVRREGPGIRCYFHLGTGNYNPATARTYGDIGFFGCDPELAADIADLFNALTGYSLKTEHRKLLVAPATMRRQLLERIEREITHHRAHGDGYLAFKMNGLVDRSCIEALYRASQAGVRIDLQVRGICCLRPGVEGLSENISVTSIVGRFLEHARMYYFGHGAEDGSEELLLGSADLMPRNLDGRVEVLFPVQNERLRRALRDDALFLHLRDNVNAWRLLSDGRYAVIERQPDEEEVDSQRQLLLRGGGWRWED
ncbi:MAG TPA: polyphosphate kinase 1 [Thermoanaerobaculia bacterium]|nr:polyphosphate kinase 1 [Thermoanaerobaculia bacterium]